MTGTIPVNCQERRDIVKITVKKNWTENILRTNKVLKNCVFLSIYFLYIFGYIVKPLLWSNGSEGNDTVSKYF